MFVCLLLNDIMDICYTCLSRDRVLFPLNQFECFMKDIKMAKCNEYIAGNICWECRHIMEKFTKFKKKVLRAQELFTVHKFDELTSLSSLFIVTKHDFDVKYSYTQDPLQTTVPKEEIFIKQENNTESVDDKIGFDDINDIDDKIYIDNDCNPKLEFENIYIEASINKAKKQKKVRNIMKNSKMMEKFSTVVYTEEEMMKKRDEKRQHPNFKKIPFKCELCVLGFNKEDAYKEHVEKKHNEDIGPLECEVCHTRFASQKSATRHRDQHYVTYRCKFCSYHTSQMWSALNHCRVKHGEDSSGSLHCGQCDVVVSTPEELAEHLKSKHGFQCNECGVKFKSKNTLRTHKIRIHGTKREFICDVCSKSFNSKSRLETHLARHSTALASRLSYCGHCRVQYNSVHVYRNHLRNSVHHASTTYPCPECNKKFASKVYWTKHYNFYHLHKSKYKCEICNKLFISNWRLKNHKQKHHGLSRSRDHACDVCGKKFYTLSTLRGHELTHSEQRTYMCEDCGAAFKQRPALYTHHRLVHRTNKTTS
ncbi:gastrula zinc finger protein XlCGF26.1-like isoform X2 [Plodia interpunctella]|uniref:gastrula zinc finger protein XlCGF26.1-like isoform X2 n=1 Tax=Plodia interpunctella TaxID=58824 RepID=UPI002367E3A3|nr:gastrula zinc finger protein XlCGF26.1-like isoform X1 [Plodia interpunctella]